MPKLPFREATIRDHGFTTYPERFSMEKFPVLKNDLERFSRILKIEMPEIYTANHAEFGFAALINNKIVLASSFPKIFSEKEIAAVIGHELIHHYEDHTLLQSIFIASTALAAAEIGVHAGKHLSRRKFLKFLDDSIYCGGLSAVYASIISAPFSSMVAEDRADLISSQLLGTGADLISFFEKNIPYENRESIDLINYHLPLKIRVARLKELENILNPPQRSR